MSIINYLNSSLLFNGCIMFIMNIGGKYLIKEFPETIDFFFNEYKFLRYLVIFSIAFVATRNIKIAILLTLLIILVMKFLLEPNSKFSLINKNKIKKPEINKNVEYQKALEIVKKYHSM